MKTSNLITALALGVVAYGIPVAEDPANKELLSADIQPVADNVNVEERGLAPATIAGPTFHPAWLPRVRPAAQAITIAGHALLMTAWVDAQNRICIILDAAFPGLHGTIIAGVQNLHNNLAVLPHVFELGKTYVAPDNQAEIQPGDTWRWFWFK
ncbi:hypothetical protein COL922a_010756 [Colletotrichum nupharicola]|nr:hypothetical protein COL922a_010756 [Colletotrichum nupharicola]